jgi:hypothetical protein
MLTEREKYNFRADSTCPRAESAPLTETLITHVTRLALDACRAAPLPFAHQKRFPWRGS